MTCLRAEALHKSYGAGELLGGLDLDVAAGEAVVLRGPNGAGKSTLLGCLAGVVIPDRGRIAVAGHDLHEAPVKARAALRYLPQEVVVPQGVTGRELLQLWADVYGGAADLPAAEAATGLGDALQRLATTYSVGMRRLLAFGGVLLGKARLLVLDEPFAGVDEDGRARMVQALVAAQRGGAGLVLATHGHDIAAVDALHPRTLVLGDTPAAGPTPAADGVST
jgi:ABC-type multidrug transport system ATPase subunit